MSEANTGGFASPDLWNNSTSWSAATIGAMDTGGSLGVILQEVVFEKPEGLGTLPSRPEEPGEPMVNLPLQELMVGDSIFRRLTERGLADFDAGRFDPL